MNVRPESTPADGSQSRWSPSTIALHWLSGLLILVLLGLGWFMVHGDLTASTKFDLYQLHKSLGFLGLVLLLLRLGARLARPSPAPPPAMPRWERRAAQATHVAFYVLLAISALSGWLLASAAIIAIPTRFFGLFVIPNLVGPDPALSASMTFLHYLVSRLLIGLLILHVGAALKHHFIDRDDVFLRMVRWR
jgi:cytochrome b561